MWLKQIPVKVLMPLATLVIGGLWLFMSYSYNGTDWSIMPALVGFPVVLPLAWWVGARVDELHRVVAQQQSLERSMRVNASRLYSVIDALDSGIVLADADGVIVNTNKPFCQMFDLGLPPQVVGSQLHRTHALVSAAFTDGDRFRARIEELIDGRLAVIRETLTTKDGRILERDFFPIALGRDYFGFLWQYSDVTERRRYSDAAQYLAEVATAIAGGDLERTADRDVPDNLTSLAAALNQMATELSSRIREREASRRRIIAAQEEVRRQVAEQLHGSVQSKLLVLGYQLGKVAQLVESQPDQAKAELEEIRQKLERLREEEVRGLSHRLHPAIVHMGLRPSLLFLRDQFEGSFAITMELDDRLSDLGRGPDLDRDLSIYRLVEELMTNALKHAQCTKLSVVVQLDDTGMLHIEVADNGKGLDPDTVTSGGLGLLKELDQVQAHDGEMEIVAQPGDGTRIIVRMPYPTVA